MGHLHNHDPRPALARHQIHSPRPPIQRAPVLGPLLIILHIIPQALAPVLGLVPIMDTPSCTGGEVLDHTAGIMAPVLGLVLIILRTMDTTAPAQVPVLVALPG